ncbi:MAG: peptidoglycan DD-metalloendopeptidase family protein [candidate division Zixibacteria bacterium]|nr:peptidoglycan DD-metalloendopeptidase family protein [candidate division Zixibacteria bacterium]
MKLRYSTLMYLSGPSDKTRTFKVPTFLIWLIIFFAVILLLGALSSFYILHKLNQANEQNRTLLEENSMLLQENRKIQLLEENLKSNTLLLRRVLNLVGVSSNPSSSMTSEEQDSALAIFLENSDVLLNLSHPFAEKEIVDVIPSGMPSHGRITRGFNPDDDNLSRRHFGVDIVNKEGSKVYATADGIVEFAGWDDIFGKMIIIKHAGKEKNEGFKTVYGHNLVNLVAEGEKVKKGDLIALSGNTGKSTGPHIHYEIRRNDVAINPEPYIKGENYSIGN